jgi:hypothetical protein
MRILRAVGARTRVADDTLLLLYSYCSHTLRILYAYFTHTYFTDTYTASSGCADAGCRWYFTPTLLLLFSYFTHTLRILYSYFTLTLLIRILRAVGARTRDGGISRLVRDPQNFLNLHTAQSFCRAHGRDPCAHGDVTHGGPGLRFWWTVRIQPAAF